MRATDNPMSIPASPPSLESLEERLFLSGNSVGAALLGAATEVDLQPYDSVVIGGHTAGQSEVYRFTAPAQGNFYINMEALDGNLDTVLQLFTSKGRKARFKDASAAGTLDSCVSLRVKAGRTYYLEASGKDGTSGAFSLELTSDPKDDFANEFQTANALRMRKGAGKASGVMNYDDDVDMFKIIATNGGPIDLSLQAKRKGNRGGQNGQMTVYNSAGDVVDFLKNNANELTITAVEGETYYVEVTGQTGSRYRLNARMPEDDSGNSIATASPQRINPNNKGKIQGSIDYASNGGDVDVFSVIALATGEMSVGMKALGKKNPLDAQVYIYNSAGELLTHDDNSGAGSSALATFDVQVGETYYIMAAGNENGGIGKYHIDIDTDVTEDPVAPPPTPNVEPSPPEDPAAYGDITVEIFQNPYGPEQMIITGSGVGDTIKISQWGESVVQIYTATNSMEFIDTFSSIVIYAGGGDDLIILMDDVLARVTVYGGEGNDRIECNSQSSAYLFGGTGNDTLISNGSGQAALYGNDGFDSFQSDDNDTIADATPEELMV